MRIKALSVIVGLTVSTLAFAATTPKDEFFWLSQINKASLVLNSQEGLLKPDVSKKIAAGIQHVINARSEEHTSELQSHYLISYAVFCLKKIFF